MSGHTVCHLFRDQCAERALAPAFLVEGAQGIREISWLNYWNSVNRLAETLHSHGVGNGDKVVILANTCAEWAIADMAILCLGAVTVPIFHNGSAEESEHILADARAKLILVQDSRLRARLLKDQTSIPILEFSALNLLKDDPSLIVSRRQFLESRIRERRLDDVATIIYTSGTTGTPKGAVLTHRQIMAEIQTFKLVGMTKADRSLAFLPFAHVLGRIEIWGHALIGYTIAFGRVTENIKENLTLLRPTIVCSVPRLFEKIWAGIHAAAADSGFRREVLAEAIKVAELHGKAKLGGEKISFSLRAAYAVADQLVYSKVRKGLGGRLHTAICGGASLDPKLSYFFYACGTQVLEGYGLTETTAAVTVNTREDFRAGSVGRPIGDTEIRIAADGEILIKSSMVMKGYHGDKEATDASLHDGWFHTGDIGEIQDGFLSITDRKKNVFKLSNGKYILPQKVEAMILEHRLISHAHVSGDGKKYLVALLTLDAKNSKGQNPDDIRLEVGAHIDGVNKRLSQHEMVKKFEILASEFSIEGSELTPSLKMKRRVIQEKYSGQISNMYSEQL